MHSTRTDHEEVSVSAGLYTTHNGNVWLINEKSDATMVCPYEGSKFAIGDILKNCDCRYLDPYHGTVKLVGP